MSNNRCVQFKYLSRSAECPYGCNNRRARGGGAGREGECQWSECHSRLFGSGLDLCVCVWERFLRRGFATAGQQCVDQCKQKPPPSGQSIGRNSGLHKGFKWRCSEIFMFRHKSDATFSLRLPMVHGKRVISNHITLCVCVCLFVGKRWTSARDGIENTQCCISPAGEY